MKSEYCMNMRQSVDRNNCLSSTYLKRNDFRGKKWMYKTIELMLSHKRNCNDRSEKNCGESFFFLNLQRQK